MSVCADPIPADSPASGIRQLRIPVEDVEYADLLIHLPMACRFIHQALSEGGVVLVHCEQGLSRSATVVAAYREQNDLLSLKIVSYMHLVMWTRRLRATDALEFIRRGDSAEMLQ